LRTCGFPSVSCFQVARLPICSIDEAAKIVAGVAGSE
jgi:hypothetical protein